jgi:hypothetical protein
LVRSLRGSCDRECMQISLFDLNILTLLINVQKHGARVSKVEEQCDCQLNAMKALQDASDMPLSDDNLPVEPGKEQKESPISSSRSDLKPLKGSQCSAANDTNLHIQMIYLRRSIQAERAELNASRTKSNQQEAQLRLVEAALQHAKQQNENITGLLAEQQSMNKLLERRLQASQEALNYERHKLTRLQHKLSSICKESELLI